MKIIILLSLMVLTVESKGKSHKWPCSRIYSEANDILEAQTMNYSMFFWLMGRVTTLQGTGRVLLFPFMEKKKKNMGKGMREIAQGLGNTLIFPYIGYNVYLSRELSKTKELAKAIELHQTQHKLVQKLVDYTNEVAPELHVNGKVVIDLLNKDILCQEHKKKVRLYRFGTIKKLFKNLAHSHYLDDLSKDKMPRNFERQSYKVKKNWIYDQGQVIDYDPYSSY